MKKQKKHYFTLRAKLTVSMLIIVSIMTFLTIIISYYFHVAQTDKTFKDIAHNISKFTASQTDGDAVEYYKSTMQKDERYFKMLRLLDEIKTTNNVANLYVADISRDGYFYIMDADKSEMFCDLGHVEPIESELLPYIDTLQEGIPALISRTKFGWLSSAGAPIFNSQGQVVAIAMVDISMNEIMQQRHKYLINICIFTTLAAAIIFVGLSLYLKKKVVMPINKLKRVAESFLSPNCVLSDFKVEKLQKAQNDEIGQLAMSINIMQNNTVEYLEEIKKVKKEKENIEAELSVATRIQTSMLPCDCSMLSEYSRVDIFAHMMPAKKVGGDFYDYFFVDDDNLAIVIADVSGKGVPAALFMVIAKTLIKTNACKQLSLSEIFENVNNQLFENNTEEMFVTAFFGIYKFSTKTFSYVNAGHNPPLLKKSNQSFVYLKGNANLVLAAMRDIKFKQYEMTFDKNDLLFLYTDGVTEACNSHDNFYGEKQLLNVLNSQTKAVSKDISKVVLDDLNNFSKGAQQFDDITIFCLRIKDDSVDDKALIVAPKSSNIITVLLFLQEAFSKFAIDDKRTSKLFVAIDEIFSNICKYSGATYAKIEIKNANSILSVVVEDDGIPFNPLLQTPPNVSLSTDERQIGGLGIFIARSMFNNISYEFANNKNILLFSE